MQGSEPYQRAAGNTMGYQGGTRIYPSSPRTHQKKRGNDATHVNIFSNFFLCNILHPSPQWLA